MASIIHDRSPSMHRFSIALMRKYQTETARDAAQRNAITAWVNYILTKHRLPIVNDLVSQVSSGVLLYRLLHIVADMPQTKCSLNPRNKMQNFELINECLTFLKRERFKLTNVGAEDVYNKNYVIVMGMMWQIVNRYQIETCRYQAHRTPKFSYTEADIKKYSEASCPPAPIPKSFSSPRSESPKSDEQSPPQQLLKLEDIKFKPRGEEEERIPSANLAEWVRGQCLPYLHVENIATDFSDGRAFAALMSSCDSNFSYQEGIIGKTPKEIMENVFEYAAEVHQIPWLLEAKNIELYSTERSVLVYTSFFYHLFSTQLEMQAKPEILPIEVQALPAHPPFTRFHSDGVELARQTKKESPNQSPSNSPTLSAIPLSKSVKLPVGRPPNKGRSPKVQVSPRPQPGSPKKQQRQPSPRQLSPRQPSPRQPSPRQPSPRETVSFAPGTSEEPNVTRKKSGSEVSRDDISKVKANYRRARCLSKPGLDEATQKAHPLPRDMISVPLNEVADFSLEIPVELCDAESITVRVRDGLIQNSVIPEITRKGETRIAKFSLCFETQGHTVLDICQHDGKVLFSHDVNVMGSLDLVSPSMFEIGEKTAFSMEIGCHRSMAPGKWSPLVLSPDGTPLQMESVSYPSPTIAEFTMIPKMVGMYIIEARDNISEALLARSIYEVTETSVSKVEGLDKQKTVLTSAPSSLSEREYLQINAVHGPGADPRHPQEVCLGIQVAGQDTESTSKMEDYDVSVNIVGPDSAQVSYDTVHDEEEMSISFTPQQQGMYAITLYSVSKPLCGFQTFISTPPVCQAPLRVCDAPQSHSDPLPPPQIWYVELPILENKWRAPRKAVGSRKMSMGEKVDFAARKEDREEERERKNSRSSTIFFTSCETRNSQEKIPTSRNRFSIRFEDVDLKHLEENFQSFSSLHTKSPELSQSQKGDGLGTKRTGAQIIRVYLDEEDTLIQKIGLPQSFSIKYTDDLRTPSLRQKMQQNLLRVSTVEHREELKEKTDHFCIVEVKEDGLERVVLRTESLAPYVLQSIPNDTQLKYMIILRHWNFKIQYPRIVTGKEPMKVSCRVYDPFQGNQIIQDHQGELVLHTISPTGTETEYPFPSQSDQKDYFKVQVPFQAVGTFWCMVRFNNVPIQSKNAKILVKK